MHFPARVNQVTFTVTISDERRIESNETFHIDLEIPSSAAKRGVIKDSPSTVTVTIVNDDGELKALPSPYIMCEIWFIKSYSR